MDELEPNQKITITNFVNSCFCEPPVPDRLWVVCHDLGMQWNEDLGRMWSYQRYLHQDGKWYPSCGDKPDWNGYHASKESAEGVLRKASPQWLWKKYEEECTQERH